MPVADISSSRFVRWAFLGSAFVAGSAALVWYLRHKTKYVNRSFSSSEPLPELAPGLENSKEMKNRGNNFFKFCVYDRAVESFSAAIKLCPPENSKHLAVCYQNRAAANDRLGNTEQSISDCTTALTLDPLYFKAVVRRAKALLSANRPEEALDDLTHASLLDPAATDLLKSYIDTAISQAAKDFIDHVKKSRTSIPVRDEPVLLWRSCYVNDPVIIDLKQRSKFSCYYGDALDAIITRNYEEVIPLLEQDLSDLVDSDFSSILRDKILISRFCLMKENIKSLKEHLESFDKIWSGMNDEARMETVNKRYRSMYFLLLAAFKLLIQRDITEDLENAIQVDESNVDSYLGAALLLAEAGKLQEAIRYLDILIAVDPHHHLVKHIRANCELTLKASTNDIAGAMACMANVDQLLKNNVDADPVLHLITGRLFYAAQNRDLAKQSFKIASEKLPQYAAPIFYLTMIEAEEMEGIPCQLEILQSKMKLCLQKEKANPDALAIMAKIAFQKQQYDEALNLYDKCVSMCPVRTNETSLAPAITDYVQIRSLRRVIQRPAMNGSNAPIL